MRVAILGGYGVFGARLAELLQRDGHEVIIVGRSLSKAQALASRLGATALNVDIRTNPEAIFTCDPDVVVDAAGPFQTYGADPYRIARLCLQRGSDYFDLSDDAAFTMGISNLNAEAEKRGRIVLSGVSSEPGISSAIAADLARDMDEIDLIDTAILPGNRAPRGSSVIASIVSQLGAESPVWRGSKWRQTLSWSDPKTIQLSPTLKRRAYFIEVPDIHLFPQFFGAKSVMFRAGLELGILNHALLALTQMRRLMPFSVTPRRAKALRFLANLLRPFGSDRGGMLVTVIGHQRGTPPDARLRRDWRLIAETGHGPYIPAVAARSLIAKLDQLKPGARACLALASRAETQAAMSDLAATIELSETPVRTLFQTALGARWNDLPEPVQALHMVHDVHSFSGTAQVTRGHSIMARFAAWVFGFPPASADTPVTVTKTRTSGGEKWQRNFGGRVFCSHCSAASALYRFHERFWPFKFELDLPVDANGLAFVVRRGWMFGLPMPRALLPTSESREFARDGVFHFDVSLMAPMGGGLIVRYQGSLTPERDDAAAPKPRPTGPDPVK